MATDNLMPQSSASIIKHFMLRSSTTGQGLTGKVHSDFTGKYNIAGGAEVTLSFSSGTAGDAYSSGKIVPLGSGKYAWHVPNSMFVLLGNVSAVLSVTGGIDVHCEWLVVAAVRDTAAFGANTTAPANSDISAAKTAAQAVQAKLPTTTHLAGAATDEGYAVLDSAGRTAIAAAVDVKLTAEHGAGSWAGGGSGGGDNTEVLEAIDSMKSIISEWVALNIPTDVRGFPATIVGGTDVEVSLEVVDSNNDPITEIFGEPVGSVQWLFGMGTSARKARITGSAVWASDLLQITITRAETLDDDDGPRTWMIGVKLTSGELKWVKTGVTRLIGRQFPEPTTTTTGA